MNILGINIETVSRDINTIDYWLDRLRHPEGMSSFESHLTQALHAAREQEARQRLALAFPCLYQAWLIHQKETQYTC